MVDFLSRSRTVAERSNEVGETFAREITMYGSVFIKFCLDRTTLTNFDHLSELFITDKYLVYLQDSLLEYKENWVFNYLF